MTVPTFTSRYDEQSWLQEHDAYAPLRDMGFTVYDTAGGCCMWCKEIDCGDDVYYITVTDGDAFADILCLFDNRNRCPSCSEPSNLLAFIGIHKNDWSECAEEEFRTSRAGYACPEEFMRDLLHALRRASNHIHDRAEKDDPNYFGLRHLV